MQPTGIQMSNVVQFARGPKRCCEEALVLALESALIEARAGRSRSGVVILADERGKNRMITAGLFKRDRGALSNLGFQLQAMAADTGFG
jgi:hypothetical protein